MSCKQLESSALKYLSWDASRPCSGHISKSCGRQEYLPCISIHCLLRDTSQLNARFMWCTLKS